MNSLEIKRAIISVWDKENIVPLAQTLDQKGVQLFSTGGTYRKLSESGIRVEKIEDLTGFPEIMGGRVKTLHPLIFSGILADSANPDHQADLKKVKAAPFQLVVVNLYPFSETFHGGDKTHAEIVEMIDIGGPSMLRAASKNYKSVAVLSDPLQYDEFIDRFKNDKIDEDYRLRLAKDVFIKTTIYDSEIASFFAGESGGLPDIMLRPYQKSVELRYGENPDQKAALYNPLLNPGRQPFRQLQGKEISFNNYIDCIAAYRIAFEYRSELAVCVNIKHTNPCGFGLGVTPLDAYKRAVKADPVSYFGGIVGVNRTVDGPLAEEFKKSFLECIVAPDYTPAALEILVKKKNLRLLIPDENYLRANFDIKGYGQGLLVQEMQSADDEEHWEVVTEKQPDDGFYEALRLAWHLVKHVKSNAIVLSDSVGSIGVGAGQMSRVDSLKIAIRKAGEAGLNTHNSVMASDAFFPFRDSIDLAVEHGIAGIIQPGGSIRDKEVIEACNEHGLFMLFTHKRVFKH
ncbi:MAG TPA: bifunctional phosphoribosylaminoimidazolecarboxamide formyltransferase/inosine monophosphate cyclohydrolase [Candidatus Marinimicrobia bacterium]|nr:bifunctional phosphoribosylaminoimidazolecarboxamide formyltransferase/inosine monophosphate cyclohydrolase [Candidatus Neomarinimicrobiota bacterium]